MFIEVSVTKRLYLLFGRNYSVIKQSRNGTRWTVQAIMAYCTQGNSLELSKHDGISLVLRVARAMYSQVTACFCLALYHPVNIYGCATHGWLFAPQYHRNCGEGKGLLVGWLRCMLSTINRAELLCCLLLVDILCE